MPARLLGFGMLAGGPATAAARLGEQTKSLEVAGGTPAGRPARTPARLGLRFRAPFLDAAPDSEALFDELADRLEEAAADMGITGS